MVEVWTIGHSNREFGEFVAWLRGVEIAVVADVRRFAGSKRHPQFRSEQFALALANEGMRYLSFPELGGRRKPQANSRNDAWRNTSFRGYADYMATTEFMAGMHRLLAVAETDRVVLTCAEALWWRCHRALISDYLKANGHLVWHLGVASRPVEHPFTSAARIVDGQLCYTAVAKEG